MRDANGGIQKLHKRKSYPVLELTQFRDFYENQHKNEELITNKPWTTYTSSYKYKNQRINSEV